jgi:DNA-binding GntR family transcriptional regulator
VAFEEAREEQILVPPAKRSLADEIADRLREAILQGQFTPGERLREERLAAALEVSRGPVREALTVLARENLVVVRRNRGTIVAHLTGRDLDEVYSLRLAVEQLAVRWAVEHATEEDLHRIQSVVNEFRAALGAGITEQRAAELDVRYHDAVYRAAHHQRLYRAWVGLRSQIQVFLLRRNIANPDWKAVMVTGHQEILDSLLARDAERAVAEITAHLAGGYDRIRESFGDRHPEPDPAMRWQSMDITLRAGRLGHDGR